MAITAKELAEILGMTPAAVSMALNGRKGVSAGTRQRVLEAAEQHGFDFSRLHRRGREHGSRVSFLLYRRQGAVVADTPFFSQLFEGVENGCKQAGLRLQMHALYSDANLGEQLQDIVYSGCSGAILLGTEMLREDYALFTRLPFPLVLLDTWFDSLRHDSVLINNVQGAFMATDYLISRRKAQPGYLHSSYPIGNFEERADGFYKAVRRHGMPTSKSVVHRLSPSVEGAFADMSAILRQGEELASCYFADNDLIAIGAMRALAAHGCRIPDDIGIIGFDDTPPSDSPAPPLSTVHVPKQYMGEMAARRLAEIMDNRDHLPVKIEIGVRLVKRGSV